MPTRGKLAYVFAVLLLAARAVSPESVTGRSGDAAAILDAAFATKESAVVRMKGLMEQAWSNRTDGWNDGGAACRAPSACAEQLEQPVCDVQFGNTAGCECAGRAVDDEGYVVKASRLAGTSDASVKAAVCAANQFKGELPGLYYDLVETGDTKWIYYGTSSGALINYPSFLWPRGDDDGCGATYDPRRRPWMMSAATGPKNVVFILDTSGSMGQDDRIGRLKDAFRVAMDSLTHADYVGVVRFSDFADTFAGLTTLARALPGFRERLVSFVDDLVADGSTNFQDAFRVAFSLVDSSMAKGYHAGCHTAYVFVTDGKADSPKAMIVERKLRVADEHFFVISLGSGTDQQALKDLACNIRGVYRNVPDGSTKEAQVALFQAMTGFYQYFALHKSLKKVEGVVWSEPYTSIPDIWGPLSTAASPVYDKSREPWHMIGVAATDSTMCDLYEKAEPLSKEPSWPADTVSGCRCAETFRYQGRSYSSCTMDDWSVPWCATENCGACSTASVSTGCWDDCNPVGSEAVVETRLFNQGASWCEPLSLDNCALEILRGRDQCGGDVAAACTAEDLSAYHWAVHGDDIISFEDGTRWTKPGFEDTLSASSRSWAKGTIYEKGSRGQCDCNSAMKPSCVCSARVVEASSADGGGIMGGIIGGTVSAVVAAAVVTAVSCKYCRRCKRCTTSTTGNQQGARNNPQHPLAAMPSAPPFPAAYQQSAGVHHGSQEQRPAVVMGYPTY